MNNQIVPVQSLYMYNIQGSISQSHSNVKLEWNKAWC